jgi:hypothetical protein
MNAPMKSQSIKTIFGKEKGIVMPPRIKKLLLGAEVRWEDSNPLSQDMDDCLHFFFDSHTKPMTDLLLKKCGITDVSQYVNIEFLWEINMQLWYETPNNKEKAAHIDHHWFQFRGTIFPMTEKFKSERDRFYLLKNLEHDMVPEDNKNKGYYKFTTFMAKVVGI